MSIPRSHPSPVSDAELGPPVLVVADLDRAVTFSTHVLGFNLAQRDDDGAVLLMGTAMVLLLTLPGAQNLLPGRPVGTPERTSTVLNIFVGDVDGALEHAREHGARVVSEPSDRPWGRRCAHVQDPDGYVWEFSRALES